MGQGPDFYGVLVSHGCNLIEDISGCTIEGDTTGNITSADPSLGVLWDNGGPTETHALNSDSPAIDAVSDECGCTTIDGLNVTTDQRGEPRPMDGHDNGSYLCDIGAYEAPGPTGPLPPDPCEQAYQAGHDSGHQEGYQEGLAACEKEVAAVGGTIEAVKLSELRATEQPYNSDSRDTHIYVALGVGLAVALALGVGFIALRRRREH